jgi:hypothetical protein
MSGSSSRDGLEKSVALFSEKETGGALPPPSSEDAEVSDVAEVAEDDSQNLTSGLPFSKARCIALVATLTGASFLNVS